MYFIIMILQLFNEMLIKNQGIIMFQSKKYSALVWSPPCCRSVFLRLGEGVNTLDNIKTTLEIGI